MNGAHFHLVINHFPIIFPIVGILVLIIGMISKSLPIKRVAFLIFIMSSAFVALSYLSGEGAEEQVEHIAGISENYIESHEEYAKIFSIITCIIGGISVIGIWASFKQKLFTNFFCIAIFIIALINLYYAKQTGTSGGEIRHTEIRDGHSPTKHIEHDED